ncbi:NACHT domain-containing protein [Paraburkholderia bannensis]|uniref:hypothetical protein n=1 Tax=Paraburkholderia bannensis TaxID=765414 RepID=UPI002ABE2475|nr:hypothetical protein [Paraburkholderia bannensis]
MVAVNWDVFSQLPGAAETNFEKLARALIRRHYGQYGEFKELANQAGVEFHLKLHTTCSLGKPGRWFGWQCKWYTLASGKAIGSTRRAKIIEGLDKSVKTLPGLTDWVLWTRHKLTKNDQDWFYGLQSQYPNFKLTLATGDDIAELLVGPAAILKEAYFGELVLTPEGLAQQHALAVAPVKRKFQPEVHQVATIETTLRRYLGGQEAWDVLSTLANDLRSGSNEIDSVIGGLPTALHEQTSKLVENARSTADALQGLHHALAVGDLPAIGQLVISGTSSPDMHRKTLAKLRSARSPAALTGANVLADLHSAGYQLSQLQKSVAAQSVAVLAAAGYGKSELAINLTLPEGDFPGGVLVLANALHAGQTLDHLAQRYKISGQSVPTFEQLLEAVDAAGQRAGRRIPIVVDGLNESEDPRVWKDLLASAQLLLLRFPYALLVVTLRTEFAEDCLPEGIERVELEGFANSPTALEDYFAFYKIDATDADLPFDQLDHPLTLRIFCEVANPTRQRTVGVEALPNSLTTLFSRYFDAVAARIAEASPSSNRIYREDVREALVLVGELLWKENGRHISFRDLRAGLKDRGGWDVSLVRSLESEGILMRAEFQGSHQRIAVVYDLMAGQLIAEHLLETSDIQTWLSEPANAAKLDPNNKEERHTLAFDTLSALVDLFPLRTRRRQLWQVAPKPLVLLSLYLSAFADPAHINRETVDELATQASVRPQFAAALFSRLRSTRAALAHPLDSRFLDDLLRKMPASRRDLSWSEWLLKEEDKIENDLNSLRARWEQGKADQREIVRARWVMWTLTTTNRFLRDVATRALYALALRYPAEFFGLMVESLTAPDPYVSERMCAVGYGAALSAWSDAPSSPMAEALPATARALLENMFLPSAPSPTRHVLLRQYCLGIIALARRVAPACISRAESQHLIAPFSQLPNPFAGPSIFTDEQLVEADEEAIRMDFGNYTIGGLVPGRHNYDYKNVAYRNTRRAIVERMLQLGYEPSAYKATDSSKRGSTSRSGSDKQKVDRYGKKYGWIAYFEMWGWRSDNGLLDSWRSAERPSDADIDPSFPGPVLSWEPTLPELFNVGPDEMVAWIQNGPTPDYRSLLHVPEAGGVKGDWVMIDGFIDETAKNDYRNVFTFIRALIVDREDVELASQFFEMMEYPGNSAIPDIVRHYYTYAGEMPFGGPPEALAAATAIGTAAFERVDLEHPKEDGLVVSVQLPVHDYAWESYHSELNKASGALLPSPNLCQAVGLRYSPDSWDLHDTSGVASLYREIGAKSTSLSGHVSYLRADLLRRYLEETEQALVWMIWGERGRHYRGHTNDGRDLHHAFEDHKHIHKRYVVWEQRPVETVATTTSGQKGKAKLRATGK